MFTVGLNAAIQAQVGIAPTVVWILFCILEPCHVSRLKGAVSSSTWPLVQPQTGVSRLAGFNSLIARHIILQRCAAKTLATKRLVDRFHRADSLKDSIVCAPHPRAARMDTQSTQVTGEVNTSELWVELQFALPLWCERRENNRR